MRKDGRYEVKRTVIAPNGTRSRKSYYGTSPEEAERNAGRRSSKALTLREFAEGVYAPTLRHRAYKTREQVFWALNRHILPALGHLELGDVALQHVQGFLTALEARYRPWTVRSVRKVFHAILQLALDEEHITRNPVKRAQTAPVAKRKDETVLTFEECAQLLRAARDYSCQNVVVLCAFMGLRLGEALGVLWSDITETTLRISEPIQYQAGRGLVSVKPKTAKSRATLPLPSRIRELIEAGRNPDSIYVCASESGKPLYPSNVRRSLTSACKAAGLPRVTPHSLRKSCATNVQALGALPAVAQAILRHSGVEMTMQTYTYIPSADVAEALERMAEGL